MLISLMHFRDIANAMPTCNALKINKNKNTAEAVLPPDAQSRFALFFRGT